MASVGPTAIVINKDAPIIARGTRTQRMFVSGMRNFICAEYLHGSSPGDPHRGGISTTLAGLLGLAACGSRNDKQLFMLRDPARETAAPYGHGVAHSGD